jgi:hypothetical protein
MFRKRRSEAGEGLRNDASKAGQHRASTTRYMRPRGNRQSPLFVLVAQGRSGHYTPDGRRPVSAVQLGIEGVGRWQECTT